MKIVVLDGQGGGIGKNLIELIRRELPDLEITAVGTNSMATSAMIRSGASGAATGENAVVYNCGDADVILAPMGMLLANSMLGEVTPLMARAVSESRALKIMIPISRCHARVAGLIEQPMAQYLEDAVRMLKDLRDKQGV